MTSEKKNPLNDIVNEYNELLPVANADLENVDSRTRAAHEAARREALDRIAQLTDAYTAAIKARQAAIFVNGSTWATEEFVGLAAQEASVISLKADALYRTLAEEVEPAMRRDRLFEPDQFARLMSALTSLGRDIKAETLPRLNFESGVILHTFDDLVAFIRDAIREKVGDELNLLFLQNKISETALKIRYQQNVVPVVLTGATEAEVSGLSALFENRKVEVKLDEEVTKETVTQALSALKNKLKNNNKEQTK